MGEEAITVRLANPQSVIMHEIDDRAFTRDSVAITYAWCIRQHNECDFLIINRAIIDRWSRHALEYIKAKAWKRFELGSSDDRRR